MQKGPGYYSPNKTARNIDSRPVSAEQNVVNKSPVKMQLEPPNLIKFALEQIDNELLTD